jgi:hypothetical protein
MKLRNGKRSINELQAILTAQSYHAENGPNTTPACCHPAKKSKSKRPRRKSAGYSISSSTSDSVSPSGSGSALEIMEFGENLNKKIQKLERKGNRVVKQSSEQTIALYELNRVINQKFIEILEYKNQLAKKISAKTLQNKESELKQLRDQHKELLHSSKKLFLEAKRTFSMAQRYGTGHVKSEQQLNTEKFAKNSKQFLDPKNGQPTQECGICMGPLQKGEQKLLVKKCKHVFHFECFKIWSELRTTCPYCRGEIEPGVDKMVCKIPENITQTISWADMTSTNISGF